MCWSHNIDAKIQDTFGGRRAARPAGFETLVVQGMEVWRRVRDAAGLLLTSSFVGARWQHACGLDTSVVLQVLEDKADIGNAIDYPRKIATLAPF